MIFEEQCSNEAIVLGDIKSNSVSIDTENIDFIVTILSTNLYSNPIESFVRETISNAWDSHVEAGIKEPVILTLGIDTEAKAYCSIRDFGVGLSPERFEKIYKNIGSSTKRGDNEQIGGFGIGRFSALAYSDIVYITSVYDGKKYAYMMYKDGNRISIDLLYDMDTTETNGLEVKVYLKTISEFSNFRSAIKKQLIFFENLFVDFQIEEEVKELLTGYLLGEVESCKKDLEAFNEAKIKNFGDFSVSTLYKEPYTNILLGKVAYPLRFSNLNSVYKDYIWNLPIFINMNIGELDITPNREEILYSKKSIEAIEKKLDSIVVYIEDLIARETIRDFTSPSEYLKALTEESSVILFANPDVGKEKDIVSFKIPKGKKNITYKGQTFVKDNLLKVIDLLKSLNILTTCGKVNRGIFSIKYGIERVTVSSLISEYNSDKYIICDAPALKSYSKDYLKESYSRTVYFISPKQNLKKIYKRALTHINYYANSSHSYSRVSFDSTISRFLLEYVKERTRNLKVFSNDSVPKTFIEDRKKRISDSRKSNKSIIAKDNCVITIFKARVSERDSMCSVLDRYDYDLCSNNNSIDKDLVVYSERDTKNTESIIRKMHNLFYLEHRKRNVTFVEVPASKIEAVKNFTNFITVKEFLNVKYKEIRKLATAYLIKDTLPYLPMLSICRNLSSISTKLESIVGELNTYVNNNTKYFDRTQNGKLLKDILDLCRDANYYDEEMKGLLMENLTLLKRAECIKLFMEGSRIPDNKVNLCIDYILARKLFRPDLEAVKKLRKETIFNIQES